MALTEKQKNCPYCHNISGHKTMIFDIPDLKAKLQGASIHCDNKRGCYRIDFPINYCPVCGRELGDDSNE